MLHIFKKRNIFYKCVFSTFAPTHIYPLLNGVYNPLNLGPIPHPKVDIWRWHGGQKNAHTYNIANPKRFLASNSSLVIDPLLICLCFCLENWKFLHFLIFFFLIFAFLCWCLTVWVGVFVEYDFEYIKLNFVIDLLCSDAIEQGDWSCY